MKSKKVIAMMVVGLVAILPAASGLMTSPLIGADNPPVASYVLDQAQEGIDYGFSFDDTVVRWQEFKPIHTSLARIDLYIDKNGEPGNLCVAVRDQEWKVLWQDIVAGGDIGTLEWIEIPVDPLISLQPDSSYYICVKSDVDSPDPDNRYFWLGQRDSDYDRGISSVESASPGYDFAFRTWSTLPCVDFEDPPLGTEYYVGDTFTDSGAVIDVRIFQLSDGRWYDDGHARVVSRGYAGGSGQEMEVTNVNLGFDFGGPWQDLSLLFGEYGGNLNIEINGDFRNFNDFIDINKLTIGGVAVSVVNGFGNDKGSLTLSGIIYSFAIGGQELVIDDVCLTAPAEKPDLIITDVWSEGGIICYQVRNIGSGVTPAGHYSGLLIDGVYEIDDYVAVDLAPGERLNRCFDYDWVCTPLQDTIEVCADYRGDVYESDETNNSRKEVWKCDVTPPEIIEGPSVSKITTSLALVSWDTDEDSDSVVKYDKAAGKYELEEKDSTLVRNHGITLTGLEPSTVYHLVVQSTDPSGNTVQSRDIAFQTSASPDSEDPVVSIIDPGICEGTVIISATASDNIGVKKVEFYVEDELVFTDYSPPYNFSWDTTKYVTPSHASEAEALIDSDIFREISIDLRAIIYDFSDRFSVATLSVSVLELSFDLEPPSVEIISPGQGDTVSETITVEALASDDESGVNRVEFYVDNEYRSCDNTSPYTFIWNTQTVLNGLHTVKAIAFDNARLPSYHEIEVTTSNLVVLLPIVVVTRAETVWYSPTCFQVGLTVRNTGGVTANNIEISDAVRGFQILPYYLQEIDGVPHRFYTTPSANPVPLYSPPCEIDFQAFDLDPGESTEIHYFIIPILPAMDEEYILDLSLISFYANTYYIGTSSTGLSYYGPDGELYTEQLSIPEFFVEGERVDPGERSLPLYRAVEEALGNADYLIVTNPSRLFDLYTEWNVNELLASMAHLAGLKFGVLAHLKRESRPEFEIGMLNRYVQPDGFWASKLHPSFSEPLGGYLLIVGETDIVPAYNVPGFNREFRGDIRVDVVRLTDNPYADTAGGREPELIVGRIIGESAHALTKPIRASIYDHLGLPGSGFERSDALLVSGGDEPSFGIDEMGDILDAEFNVEEIYWGEYADDWDMYFAFTNAVPDNDVICFSGHGNQDCWCYGLNINAMPFIINLGDKNPFAFALSCLTGNYEIGDDDNIAEFFFDMGAAVYIGSTEIEAISHSNDAGKRFFRTWEASESIGEAFTAMERERMRSDGTWWKYWVYEYNLYGDPKYGRVARPPMVQDQAQEGATNAFLFDNDVIRWQEFKPTQRSLSQIDLHIYSYGNPGNVRVMIKNSLGAILWETTIFEESVGPGSWVNIAVSPSVPLIPGNSYYIYVWSDTDSPSHDNRYYWVGQRDSDYDRGISSMEESGWPGFDFTFRTWSASEGDASATSLTQKALLGPLSSLEVVVPDYEVTTTDGLDYVEIPDGMLLLVDGKPQVPYYTVFVDYPQGYEIQDVNLAERYGLTTATGINIPTVIIEPGSSTGTKSSPAEGEDWYPEETYTWRTFENPNGSITLVIIMYPFYYNPLTTDVRFYKNYSFNIDYTISKVEISKLETDSYVYEQGEQVLVDLEINNAASEAKDVLVDAVIEAESSGVIVDGLLLHTLEGLTGPASFSPEWDSTGFEPGYYYVKVTLKGTDGNVLDRRTEMFRLGISLGEITNLSATPEFFDVGDEIDISIAFNNTGTVNITGTAVIEVQDKAAELVQEFRHEFTDLAPSDAVSFDDTWDTSGAEEGTYTIVGYVLYDAKATNPATTTVSTSDPPNIPGSPSPAHHATGVSVNADLSWSGGDPDAGDTVTYDVYFGTSASPLFEETIGPYPATEASITYDPGSLTHGTEYYWQIVARDSHGITEQGPVWDFTTGYVCEVDISVVLQGGSRPSEGWEVPITIKFFSPGADVMSDTPIEQFDLTTLKSDSTAVCQCTVDPGTYDVTVVSEHTLINVKRDVVISAPSTAVDMGTLLEGNANDDIIINISDFGVLAVSYMKMDGEAGYDPRADFDRNGIINISDFGLLAVNYMKMSPIDIS